MLKMKSFAMVLAIAGVAGLGNIHAVGAPRPSAQADQTREPWQKDFDDVCSKTQDAMTFSIEELTALVRKCDELAPKIEQLDETRKKVYMGRLRMCRGLYAYVLESKKSEKK